MNTFKRKTLAAAMRPAIEAEQAFSLAVQHTPGKVQVIFPQPVQLMTLSPWQAHSLSLALAHHAIQANGGKPIDDATKQ